MAIVPLEVNGTNVYEIAIAAAKEARRLNDLRLKRAKEGILGEEEIGVKVTVKAVRGIMEGRAKVVYPSNEGRPNHVEQ